MMITIVKFRVFDRDLEKNFYNNETIFEIHKTLKEISHTYIPKEVIMAESKSETQAKSELKALTYYKQQDEKL